MAEPKGKRLAIVNQKGGTGKTTVSVNLSVGLAKRKFKTLLINLDPQHNATDIDTHIVATFLSSEGIPLGYFS